MIDRFFVPICLAIVCTVAAFVFHLTHPFEPIDPNSVDDDNEDG